ncbi:uncharacterized protein LOC132615021 [Lycium barbarum]|uniref:uncharacterized protein LOC132615021 n=1 Tax=Lycium barbarum TaxID=112863 RepID=UPI00293EFAFC|nr:uncharacterized protein LOC132615021 [Lycium barbarum]
MNDLKLDPESSSLLISQSAVSKKKTARPLIAPSSPSAPKRKRKTRTTSFPDTTVATNESAEAVEAPPIVEIDEEETNDDIPLKSVKASTSPIRTPATVPAVVSTVVPATAPLPSTGLDGLDQYFEETETTGNLESFVSALGFEHLLIPQGLPSSSRSRRSHSFSRSNLVNIFTAPIADPTRRRTTIISIPEDTNFLGRPVGVTSYLKPLISESDKEKMRVVTWKCLINDKMHASNKSSILTGEGLCLCLVENDDLKAQLDAQEREILHLRQELERRNNQSAEELPSIKAWRKRLINFLMTSRASERSFIFQGKE